MCIVSAVGDDWSRTVPNTYPWVSQGIGTVELYPPTRQEFEQLKTEIQELKKLLEAAKAFDEATGQPDCHMDDKVALIKKLAEYVGVDISDVFN